MRLVLLALDGIRVPSSSGRLEQFRCGSYGKSPHFRLEDAVEGGGEAAGLLLDLPVSCGLRASSEESCCSITLKGTNAGHRPGEALQAYPTYKDRVRLRETPQSPHRGDGGGCEAVLRPAVTRVCKTRSSVLFVEAMNSSLRVHPSRLSCCSYD